MEDAAPILVAVCCIVIGVSHLARSREWAEFFTRLREMGSVGGFVVALSSGKSLDTLTGDSYTALESEKSN